MQGVDRLDQIRSHFSLADGHTFQKWHIKLAMAFIDIARVNAYMSRKLACAELRKARQSHRDFVKELSAELISSAWKQSINEYQIMYEQPRPHPPSTPSTLTTTTTTAARSSTPSSTETSPFSFCTVRSSKQHFIDNAPEKKNESGRRCVICKLEGRSATTLTQFCETHNVSLCMDVHKFIHPSNAASPYDWTCWEKFHNFYQPKFKAFSERGTIIRKGRVYNEVYPKQSEVSLQNAKTNS